MIEIVKENDVTYAGVIAGYKSGLLINPEGRILITRGPNLITPKKGEWPTIQAFLESLFSGYDQEKYIYGWLKSALLALYNTDFTPGQTIVIAGKAGAGKSFFQNHIVTPLLGGRSAMPFRYLSGKSEFNSELTASEHLTIGDEVPPKDYNSRRQFGAKIKDIVANENHSHHAKGKDAIKVSPFWRLSISLNDDAEYIMILPPLDESLADKIMLFQTSRASNLPKESERAEFREKIYSELPAFAHFLLKQFKLPKKLRCCNGRYGVTHFHHPELLEKLKLLDPEMKLHEIIQGFLFSKLKLDKWEGKALDLEKSLKDSKYGQEAKNLIACYATCGRYLGRLEKAPNTKHLYSSRKVRGHTIWTILPEVDEVD